jgi:hypothetical protein
VVIVYPEEDLMAAALSALITLVAHAVLYTRKHNENSDTAMDPVDAFDPKVHDDEFLAQTGSFCFYWDDNRLVECKLYAVHEIALPSWLPLAEYIRDSIGWKYTWGADIDPCWPEAWQRGLYPMSTTEKSAAARLLRTHIHNRFRSSDRRSLAKQLVEWLETPADDRRYDNPFSRKQWGCLVNRDNQRTGDSIYGRRGGCFGAPRLEVS